MPLVLPLPIRHTLFDIRDALMRHYIRSGRRLTIAITTLYIYYAADAAAAPRYKPFHYDGCFTLSLRHAEIRRQIIDSLRIRHATLTHATIFTLKAAAYATHLRHYARLEARFADIFAAATLAADTTIGYAGCHATLTFTYAITLIDTPLSYAALVISAIAATLDTHWHTRCHDDTPLHGAIIRLRYARWHIERRLRCWLMVVDADIAMLPY